MLCIYIYCKWAQKVILCGLLEEVLDYIYLNSIKQRFATVKLTKFIFNQKTRVQAAETRTTRTARCTVLAAACRHSVGGSEGSTNGVKDVSTSAAKQAFRSTDRHAFYTCRETGHRVMHMLLASLLLSFL